MMQPYTPILAARLRSRRAIAFILGLGLVGAVLLLLGGGSGLRRSTSPAADVLASPLWNAADLVGVYRSSACTLTLDASGTYVRDCGDVFSARYAIAGDDIVLGQPVGARRLSIWSGGRLVADDGTVYAMTGDAP